jgi:hypothetical protein
MNLCSYVKKKIIDIGMILNSQLKKEFNIIQKKGKQKNSPVSLSKKKKKSMT